VGIPRTFLSVEEHDFSIWLDDCINLSVTCGMLPGVLHAVPVFHLNKWMTKPALDEQYISDDDLQGPLLL
jgi:hypothetical protein